MCDEIKILLAKQDMLMATARLDVLVDIEQEKLNDNHRFALMSSNVGMANITFLESLKVIIQEIYGHSFLSDTFEWRERNLEGQRENMPKTLTIEMAIKTLRKTAFKLLRLVYLKHMSLVSTQNLLMMNPENEFSLGAVSEQEIELLCETIAFLNFVMDIKTLTFWRRIFKDVRTR